jgi:transglutaminase-like putative cysteine protease
MTDLLAAALLAALPLPLTGLVPWWAAGLYALPLAAQGWRSRRGVAPPALKARWMNLLSLACLALFVLDMAFLSRRLIQVAVHLSLSLIALKAFHLRSGRDQAQFALLVFFLAVAGAANSTHPALALHLLALAGLFCSWMMRGIGASPGGARRGGTLLVLACLVLAGPLFLMLPRLRGPYVPGGRARPEGARTFSLDTLGVGGMADTADDERVALRVRFEGGSVDEEALRLRARTFSVFRRGNWSDPGARYRLRRFRPDGRLWLGPQEGSVRTSLEAFPKDLTPQYLPLPYGAAGLEAALAYAHAGDDGTVRLSPWLAQRQFSYRVFIDRAAAAVTAPPEEADGSVPEELAGVLRTVADRAIPADRPAREQAGAMLRLFAMEYRYGLEDYEKGPGALAEFLLERKRGHCEMFASAGALLLRTRGIPARVAAGFMGGEHNPFQDYYVVRFRNAHAWVEAWIDGEWIVLDPTPPEFRPPLERGTMQSRVGFMWETVSFFWDRYVIGFAFPDQMDLLRALEERAGAPTRIAGLFLGLAALGMLFAWALRRRRPMAGLMGKYRRLRRRVALSQGLREDTLAPEGVEAVFRRREPALDRETTAFFQAYRRGSFGPEAEWGSGGEWRIGYRRIAAAARRWKRPAQTPR